MVTNVLLNYLLIEPRFGLPGFGVAGAAWASVIASSLGFAVLLTGFLRGAGYVKFGEVGTSSYYASIGATAEEPVLREICRNIAADELRHYKLFYSHLRRYLEHEGIGKWKRVAVALSRIGESEDDELAYAFYAANENREKPYDRKANGRAYMKRAFACYRRPQVQRAVAMIFKAAGLNPQGRAANLAAHAAYGFIRLRGRMLKAA
jgi:hypothetical protein